MHTIHDPPDLRSAQASGQLVCTSLRRAPTSRTAVPRVTRVPLPRRPAGEPDASAVLGAAARRNGHPYRTRTRALPAAVAGLSHLPGRALAR